VTSSGDGGGRQPTAVVVPLLLDNPGPATVQQPVTVGVPFPRGALLHGESLHLLDPRGEPIGVQALPLARWPDGTVRWLLLDFMAESVHSGTSRWTLRTGRDTTAAPWPEPVRIDESAACIDVSTGVLTIHLRRGAGPLPAQVVLGGEEVLDPQATRFVLTDARGRTVPPEVESFVVEDRGPVRVTVRLEGTFPGRARCRFVARLCFFAGTGLVRLRLTLHNPARARHRGGLWDLGDAGSVLFRDLSMEVALRNGPTQLHWTAEPGQVPGSLRSGNLEIYQDSSGGANWRSRNHVNRRGQVPCSFRGYRLRHGGRESRGLRAAPVVALQQAGCTLAAAIPEFWQQFPTAMEADGNRLRIRFFPKQWGDVFELQGGEQKTHTAWLRFAPGEQPDVSALAWVHQPARAQVPPEEYARAGVIADPRVDDRLESLVSSAVDGDNSLAARRETIDEFGWRNYGELYADHEAAHAAGPQQVISHYNNQYDVVHGALLQLWRTGDARWWNLLDPLARHVIDIDIYHTKRDKPAYNGGLFWHTDHYRDAATCTHRAYSRGNCGRGDRSYGGGPSNEHNYTTGLLHYHYLTGDPAARDAVLGLADWVLAMDDGRRTVLGLVDDGPTGRASCTRDLAYQGPGRGCGNSVNALLDGWLLSGRQHYLDYAETLIRRCIHPDDDVAARDLLNVEERWSYTVFLSVLARYLNLKAAAGEPDRMYAYARASLLRYAVWMADHEQPYFDHPEKLEYPTETWAAQELRKANVLRLAARLAAEPLRDRLLRRGEEFAERAWQDLQRFASCTVTRALALLMAEGTRDSWLRSGPFVPAPAPAVEHGAGPPERFIPQRQRVLAQVNTARGLARALVRLVGLGTDRKGNGAGNSNP
jgi:hypothetical protein